MVDVEKRQKPSRALAAPVAKPKGVPRFALGSSNLDISEADRPSTCLLFPQEYRLQFGHAE
jgi:hypothetical protein